jgi:hypothetical protein
MVALPGGGVLVGARAGLFFADEANGKVSVTWVDDLPRLEVFNLHIFPGGGILIHALAGWFIARNVGSEIKLEPASDVKLGVNGIRSVIRDFAGGVLIQVADQWFLVRRMDGNVVVARAANGTAGTVNAMLGLPGGGVMIGAEKGLFLAREVDASLKVERAGDPDTGVIYQLLDLSSGGVMIGAEKGLFLARVVDGNVKVERAGEPDIGEVSQLLDLSGGGVMIGAEKGLFLARVVDGNVKVERAGDNDTGSVRDMDPFLGKVLIQAEKGWFIAREEGDKIRLASAGNLDTGEVTETLVFAGGLLIGAQRGLFLAREDEGIARVGSPLEAPVNAMTPFPGGGELIQGRNGWFLAREDGGKVSLTPVGGPDTGGMRGTARPSVSGGLLIMANNGVFATVQKSLTQAQVDIPKKKDWNGKQIEARPTPSSLALTIEHECAPSADRLGINVRMMRPGEQAPGRLTGIVGITPGETSADLAISPLFNEPGQWSFQVVATSGGVERQVGEAQTLTFVSGPWFERWWKILTIVFGLTIALLNLVLFGIARRSAWAWRVATDDGWGTWMLRVATLALSHIKWAQLWIIDLYFQRIRKQLQGPRPFLPLPLTATDGQVMAAADALAPPWKGKRIWVQGASGMGKTAIFRHFTEMHFREYENAFLACAGWGCMVVPFAARDFASSGEDKDDPAWVVDAVRATLSSEGLTFTSSTLLSRFLDSGTIGIAIDGLNEVDRTRAVAAFSRAFSEAPVLVTSQQPGPDRFVTWRLPSDIRAFTFDLLCLYLSSEDAETVMKRIGALGLQDAIRSGYDVRLVIDLARTDPQNAPLPADRMGLYAAVIEAGWPDASDDVRQEQQSLLAAAAWRMVSERKPNEDMRRLKPDADLPANLLKALADAPQNDDRPVPLVRRVGGTAFEFVHDQMHTYLAARWFAQEGISTAELEKMVASSTIWTQSSDARRTLWGFAAALLDNKRLLELWGLVEEKEEWDVLRRALKAEAEQRGIVERKPEVEKT